jgi:WD40 repeat protein/serine/threonine protein kinase
MADRTGQQLGNYRLVRLLGHGGFAEVYLGEHRYLKSYAALKVLRTALKGKDIDKFISEAQTLVGLRHPNIVRVLEFAIDRGTPVLVMDYAPGGSLRKQHPRGSFLSLPTVVSYVKQVAAALQYAHNKNLIHRDVKPENMLIGLEQQILLSDFGIAVLSSSPELLPVQGTGKDTTLRPSGTIPYAAPEQLQGKPTFASDQYSLAVVIYEWLCGKRPFEGNNWEIIEQHLSAAPPPMHERFPELPTEVEAVVLRALSKEPQQRFPSVQAFSRALARAAQLSDLDVEEDGQNTAALKERTPSQITTRPDQTTQRIFLSASSADDAFVTRLKADLERRGLLIWNSQSDSTLKTLAHEDSTRQGIRAARFALVVLTPYTPHSQIVKEHLRIASIYERQLIFVWADGDDITTVLPEEWGKTTSIDLVDARGSRYEQALDQIITSIGEQTTAPLPPTPLPSQVSGEPRNPYKGLRAFTKDDAIDFFGRDGLISELTESLKNLLASGHPRLLAVLGPSGSGKSSIVMAGLIPRLQKRARNVGGELASAPGWVYLPPIVPGKHPVESLLLAITPFFPNKSSLALRQTIEDEAGRGLSLLAAQLVKEAHRGGSSAEVGGGPLRSSVVLIVDQFEELFTQTTSEEERRHFINLLVTAATEPHSPLIVILTLRADFYDRPLFYPALGRLIQQQHRVVLPMDTQDLRAVIEQPAALPDVLLTFEGNLVGDLLFETQGQAGALPLLEFTLDQLYQRRDGHWLTQQAYQEIGGVRGALAKHAESTYTSLPSDEHRRLVRALFLRLIDPGVTEQDTTRRRASLAELALPDPQQTNIMYEAATAFIAARLLTTNEIAGVTTIEVSHEALIREWQRLADWLREAREDIVLQQAISADSAEWLRRGKPADRLYRGSQLIEAQTWAERNVPSTNEVAFIRTSLAESQQQEAAEFSRQARELNLERRAVSRLRLLVTALSIFSVVVLILASVAGVSYLYAQAQQKQAELQAQIATSRAFILGASNALTKSQIDEALLYSVKANQAYNTSDTRNSLLNALEYSPRLLTILQAPLAVNQLVFRPDGQTLVSLGSSQTLFAPSAEISLWNIKTRIGHIIHLDFRGITTPLSNLALSPNGQIVAGSSDQGLWLWDASTGKRMVQLEPANQHSDTTLADITPIAFSPDGNLLASARCSAYDASSHCTQGRLLLWNLTSQPPNSQQLAQGSSLFTHLVFSVDGKTLFASSKGLGSDTTHGSLQLFDVTSGKVLIPQLADFKGIIGNFALSPDGKTIAASDTKNSIFLWDVASQKATSASPLIAKGAVQNLAFSPDNMTLVSSSNTDNTVQLWDISSGLPADTALVGHDAAISSFAFSTDGKTLASSDANGSIYLWNMASNNPLAQTLTYPNRVRSAIFSPDGKFIVAGDDQGKVMLKNAVTGNLLTSLDASQNPVNQGNTTLDGTPLSIESIAFSPDQRIVAAGRFDGTIFLWDATTEKLMRSFRDAQHLRQILFSPNGSTLAASYETGTIVLWDVATGHMLHRLTHPPLNSLRAFSIAFSPDSKMLASGNNNTVIFWDTATGKQVGQPLTGQQAPVEIVAFSPDGHTLASIDENSQVMLWNLDTMKPLLSQPFVSTDPVADTGAPSQSGLAFSPDSTLLAVGSSQSAIVWNIVLPKPERLVQAFRIPAFDPFNPDTPGFANIRGVEFSPGGNHLLVISDNFSSNYAVTVWNINTTAWQTAACTIANRNLTLSEWQQLVGTAQSYQKVCANLPVDSSVTQDELTQAHAAVLAGHMQDAQMLYQQAAQEASLSEDDILNNSACFAGATDQFANQVLSACNRAITLNPYNGQYYDSRAVARALTGDRAGAIADFTFFVQWATDQYLSPAGVSSDKQTQYKQLINERKSWIAKLQAGHNPFNASTLNALRVESGIDL